MLEQIANNREERALKRRLDVSEGEGEGTGEDRGLEGPWVT